MPFLNVSEEGKTRERMVEEGVRKIVKCAVEVWRYASMEPGEVMVAMEPSQVTGGEERGQGGESGVALVTFPRIWREVVHEDLRGESYRNDGGCVYTEGSVLRWNDDAIKACLAEGYGGTTTLGVANTPLGPMMASAHAPSTTASSDRSRSRIPPTRRAGKAGAASHTLSDEQATHDQRSVSSEPAQDEEGEAWDDDADEVEAEEEEKDDTEGEEAMVASSSVDHPTPSVDEG